MSGASDRRETRDEEEHSDRPPTDPQPFGN
jgi:hypothetical protein